jgi:acetyl-CoA carboxylase biotin carboxyl carrier protein
MRIDEIRRLIKLVEESQINELEVRSWWSRVRILKRSDAGAAGPMPHLVTVQAPASIASAPSGKRDAAHATGEAAAGAAGPAADAGEESGLSAVRSPMVGTFYCAPSPSSPPYVDVGQRVAVGQVVCIVEAMKLMNEIESEVAGTIAKVLVQNGMPVEFNQPLFLVRPD